MSLLFFFTRPLLAYLIPTEKSPIFALHHAHPDLKIINFGGKLSFILFSCFPERLHLLLHTFSLLPPLQLLYSLSNLNVHYAEFQHFILRFNKNFLTLQIPLKEGTGVKGGPKTG
jgi:hypothetical protein